MADEAALILCDEDQLVSLNSLSPISPDLARSLSTSKHNQITSTSCAAENTATAVRSNLNSEKKSDIFNRARRTLPNIFTSFRRQSTKKGKKSVMKMNSESEHLAVKDTKRATSANEEIQQQQYHHQQQQSQQQQQVIGPRLSSNAKDSGNNERVTDIITVTRTQASLENSDPPAVEEPSQIVSRLKLSNSQPFEGTDPIPALKKNRKTSFQLMLPTNDHASDRTDSPVAGPKSRRATSFSCAENSAIIDISGHKKRRSFLRRIFSDKRKIKRSASTKSKSRLVPTCH